MSADERATDLSDRATPEPPASIDPAPVLRLDEDRRRRLRPWAIAGAASVALVTGTVALSYSPIFGARVVKVEGEERLAPRQVMRLAGIERGTNVVHLDTSVAESRLEAEPWVLDATVARSLPSTITISVRERIPVLVLVAGETRQLVATDGTALGRAPRDSAFPEVTAAPGSRLGRSEIEAAGLVVRSMAPEMRARVDSITVTEDGSVSLVVEGDVAVRYGIVDDTAAKSQALRAILRYAENEGRELISIDLSAPAAPTARFVGSQQPLSGPDPSADVPPVDPAIDGHGTDGGAQGAPSSSP
ncbi:MAG TPA: FtsQ-type POTRA domain-containing protein [Actinomycetota bacterium]|nr:FtsQ-type POTRA domain-containing protein [Actinomycetota bacterium]